MIFRMDQLLFSFSAGLDYVEKEVLGSTTNHGKRIAIVTVAMGKHLGMSNDELIGLAACSIMHDNALSEFKFAIDNPGNGKENMRPHCIKGEENVSFFPLPSGVEGFVKYHHEHADGSGPFGLTTKDIPLGAQLIVIVDGLDLYNDLSSVPKESINKLRKHVQDNIGILYSEVAAKAFLAVFDEEMLARLTNENVNNYFYEAMPKWVVDQSATEILTLSKVMAGITDYKSKFTAKHSTQIANKAYWMARYYGFDNETAAKVFLAAALHDIGKLVIPIGVLEKLDKLNDEEMGIIKSHVYWSYLMLKDIEGFEEVCRWAVTHHKKLNGSGYPDFLPGYVIFDFVTRLMACLDIYQAVRETRPYHAGRTHKETMVIMQEMVKLGEIDAAITNDLDKEMAQFNIGDGDVPAPTPIAAAM